jgi:hypothetical protein
MRGTFPPTGGEHDPYYQMMLSWLAHDHQDGAELGFLPERDTPPRPIPDHLWPMLCPCHPTGGENPAP